ncbi:hypothetical protein Prudu_011236 [Prunus dulcis]|uniref:Uncharacterized protein n=1 Tax=Prunus dulcis TaxID=3755 RepID=A0A4Y1RA61_PRUDU|nr:hypothetical protein Prudu_011236 [Prunus dulcis]
MDLVSSLECLKLDSQSEVLHKDGGGKDLLSPDIVPLNCDTPIIGSKAEEQKAAKQCLEKPSTFLNRTGTLLQFPFLVSRLMHQRIRVLLVGDHISQLCPYKSDVPKNAIVGSGCAVLCKVCGCRFKGSCCAKCGISQGRAVFMNCSLCEKQGEHMNYECPTRKKKYYPSFCNCDPYMGLTVPSFSFQSL